MYLKSKRQLALIAWLNITAQISCSFLGLYNVAVAEVVNPETQSSTTVSLVTKVHTIEFGESIESILKKYNMSLDLFYRLNPSYNSSQSQPALRVGDRINLPLNPLPEEITTASKVNKQDNKIEKHIANAVVTAGGILSNENVNSKDVSDQLQTMATSLLSNKASGALQQWLGQYGHARVQLGVDKDFSLKSSKYDFLAPLVDRENSLLFLQNSIHRTDDRTQTNVGLGGRYFADDYMLGGNVFWDYDISRGHSRASVGVEYWRNYLKLAANNYFRLSDWKDSNDFQAYEERAASGWDIRMEGYLPFYPQLGAKLSHEQYYGDEVALFGRSNLQKDPYATTVGVTYTPIPLLTIGAEHIRGQADENDTRLSAQLNYRLGVPWAQQIDPHAVNTLRSLAGSRYDFVERNNNIVLEYRKKESILLTVTDYVTGNSAEEKPLDVSVTATHGFSHTVWSAPELEAAGGKLIVDDKAGTYKVVLPTYRGNTELENTYNVYATAFDLKGNQSNQTLTKVVVQASNISSEYSTFNPLQSTLPADGTSIQTLTLSLFDNNQQPIDEPVDNIKLTISSTTSAKVSSLVRKSAGVYEITVTAGTDNESITIIPEARGVTLATAVVNIGKVVTSKLVSFEPNKKIGEADGNDTVEFTAKVVDQSGKPVTGAKVNFKNTSSGSLARLSDNEAITDAQGIAKITVSDSWVEEVNLEASLQEYPEQKLSTATEFSTIFTHIEANGANFAVDSGFPSMGWNGQSFRLILKSRVGGQYLWTVNGIDAAKWVEVKSQSGSYVEVKIEAKNIAAINAAGGSVTIVGTPEYGKIPLEFKFQLKALYNVASTGNASADIWNVAHQECLQDFPYSLPTQAQFGNGSTRSVGTLLGEWGLNVSNEIILTTDRVDSQNHIGVDLSTGNSVTREDNNGIGEAYHCIANY